MNVEWPPLIIGAIVLVGGTVIAMFSPQLSAGVRELNIRMFGSLGRFLGPGTNRWSMAPAGVIVGLVGVAAILTAVFRWN